MAFALWAAVLAGCSGSSDDSDSAPAGQAAASSAPAPAPGEEQLSEAKMSVKFDTSVAAADQANSAESGEAAAPAQAAEAPAEGGTSAASFGSPEGASLGAIADANAGFNRKMIYSANVVLKAKSFAEAEERVSNAIFQSGGFIVQFADTKSEHEIGSTYVIKVPSSGLSNFLTLLKEIPSESFERKMQGNDVTEEYVDLQARLEAKQKVEARLLAFMDKATKADDLVRFSTELGGVQQEIEQIKGRMRYLDQNVAYSTVNLRLYESIGEEVDAAQGPEKKKSLGGKLSNTMQASLNVLGDVGAGILTFLAAILPVLLVLILVGGPVAWVALRNRRARRARAEARRRELNAKPEAARISTEDASPHEESIAAGEASREPSEEPNDR
ncbi:hypothetical protein J19TS2_28560 [Cohnella xylanilytica]|uniref:DUF4349 domain-containing protein n=1 Tax=Cohnella xylanilytica TaxID=557555 RepID=UPI001B034C3D|nr:DUF4349 domain-containing protein [Cohnella xylanilytica]GIO13301.1 hypothetical protein J19TS2_28560 [Cohnella xylanilytica]